MVYSTAIWNFGVTCMLLMCVSFPLASTAITLEVGPQNKTVVEGDRVSLICDINNDNDDTIFWTYLIGPDNRRYISSNTYIYPFGGYGVDPLNYEVNVDEAEQTYELVIFSVVLSTEAGIYECGYEYGPNRKYTPLASAMITVSPIPESLTCHMNLLSSLGSELSQEYEVACSWTHSQPGEAHFDSSNGETIDVDLRFPSRIISRLASSDTPIIVCRFMLDNDASVTINAPCTEDSAPALVRVDPFISEVALGSNTSFICTSNEFFSSSISWDVSVNGSAIDQGRLVENNEVITLVNVQDADQYIVLVCQAHISEDTVVSSYASLRVVEATTSLPRRPPGESRSHRTTEIGTTTRKGITEVTNPALSDDRGGMGTTVAMIVILFIILVLLIIVIVFLIIRRKRRPLRRKYSEGKAHTYDAIELEKIPHTRHDGSSQLYAVSFKDKKSKRHRSVGVDAEEAAGEGHINRSFSSSCGMLNLQPESTDEQIYAEPDAPTKSENQFKNNSRRLCNSMPFLDVSEYETISDQNARSTQMAKTLSSLSISSNRSSHGDRRWTSQRMTKDAPWTPPLARHASSFRKPVVKNSSDPSDYTQMTIENKPSTVRSVSSSPGRIPLYAKPDKKKKAKNKEIPSAGNEVEGHVASDYADIEDVGSRSPSGTEDEFLDTYLSGIPGPFNSSLPENMKNNKAASLHLATSSRPGPPKPQRGKCQSMGIPTYSSISDYEIMSKQGKQINEEENDYKNDNDYDECDQNESSFPMSNYDQPRNSRMAKTAHTLPRLNEGAVESMMKQGYGREARRVKSLDQSDYELIGNEGGYGGNSIEVPQSPQYADIGDTMNAYASVLDNDVSASEWRQADENDYSDFD